MATYTISRLAGPTHINPVASMITVLTVPASNTWVVKSMYFRNTRADAASISYTVYVVPSGDTAQRTTQWLLNQVAAPGELQTFEFNLLVLNVGDTIVVNATVSNLYAEIHGAKIT